MIEIQEQMEILFLLFVAGGRETGRGLDVVNSDYNGISIDASINTRVKEK